MMKKKYFTLFLVVLYMTIVLYLTVFGRNTNECYKFELSLDKIQQLFTVGYYGHDSTS